ncbi:major facilitator superfamily domain-containing protein [Aspergillus ambiguus]|uniref:putative MFS transporter n=1 Tax=Aspergillus ambiguus TaxID=176160 RepID=UPI003CCCF91A
MFSKLNNTISSKDKEAGSHEVSKADVETGQIESLDEAELFLQRHGVTNTQLQEMLDDPERSKKLRRRVDRILLPLLCGTYCLQYIDKQALSYSAVFDLFTDANISSNQYSWLASLFYFELANHSAPITPCFMMIVGMWYLRQEQPLRAGCFYACNGVGSMLGGLLTYGIGQMHSFPVWRGIFLICGGITVVWGVVLLIFLPNSILTAKRFTVEEKILLIGRGKKNQTGILNRKIKWYQIREALVDPQTWLLFLFTLLNETVNGGVANFGKLIIKGLVSSPLLTTALGIPQGAFSVVFVFTAGYFSTRFKNARTIIMIIYLCPTIIGISLLWKLPRSNRYGVLFGYYILGAYVGSLVLALQMPSTNTAGYTKRVTSTAFVFLAYCIGNIIGPHAFLSEEAPIYQTGCRLILGCALCQMACAVALRVLLISRNQRRDKMGLPAGGSDEQIMEDLTDYENPRFRYVL